jgi:hypothetical protein
MGNDRPTRPAESDAAPAFSASIRPNRDGGWLTVVHLGDGASLTKWFPSQDEAKRYPGELAEWLARGRESVP